MRRTSVITFTKHLLGNDPLHDLQGSGGLYIPANERTVSETGSSVLAILFGVETHAVGIPTLGLTRLYRLCQNLNQSIGVNDFSMAVNKILTSNNKIYYL